MRRQVWAFIPALALGGMRWGRGPARPDDGGVVSFTGSVHGAMPPVACIESGTAGIPMRSFEEMTSNGSRYRAFRIQLSSSCVAPLFQALFSREALEVRAALRSGAGVAAFGDAHLTRVELAMAPNERGAKFPVVTVELTSSRVSGVSSPRLQTTSFSDVSPVPRGSAEAWVKAGIAGTSIRLAGQPAGPDITFASGDQRIVASWSVDDETGRPRDDLRIVVDPIDKAAGNDDAALTSAAQSRRELSEAVISFLGRDGAAGIVVWLKRASLAGFVAPAPTPNGVRGVGRVTLVTRQLTITDIGSGRTAAFP